MRPPSGVDHVEPIGLEDLARLGINSSSELFWDGRRVEIRRRLDFTGFQKLIAGVVTIVAVLGGLGGFVTGLNNASIFLCARHIEWLSCPATGR